MEDIDTKGYETTKSFQLAKNGLSDVRAMNDLSYTVPMKLDMSFGIKSLVIIRQHLHESLLVITIIKLVRVSSCSIQVRII